MKKILNIAIGDMSTGELTIALAFAKNQNPDKYKNYFLVHEEKRFIIGDEGFDCFYLNKECESNENRKSIEDVILKIKPDLIVLFDIFTFEYAQSWTGCCTDYLKQFDIPIASIDEYEYTKTNYKIDYYGVFVNQLPALLKKCDYIFKNCPLTMPQSEDEDKGCFYYRVFQELPRITEEERNEYREKYFGVVDKREKVVFFVTSLWEISGAYSFSCQNNLSSWLGPILYEYLNDLDTDIVLAHVGSENWELNSNNKVKYVHYDSIPVNEYEKAMQAADVFVTYNIASISLSKAVLYEIPSIVLNNRKIIEFANLQNALQNRPQWYQNMAAEVKKIYPFAASMFGWSNFLSTCLNENIYVKSFCTANVFQYNATLDLFRNVIFDESYYQLLKKGESEFANHYYKIRSSEEILQLVFREE